jgi:hypothetical protein
MEKYNIGQLNKKTVKPACDGTQGTAIYSSPGRFRLIQVFKVRILGIVKFSVEISFLLCAGSI